MKILIVDDEPHILRIMQMSLQKLGHEIETAPDGVRGLEKFRQFSPDVMIADIEMPNMNGRDMCHAIHEEFPKTQTHIFVASSRAEDEFRSWVSEYENMQFLEKPLSIRLLLRELDNLEVNSH